MHFWISREFSLNVSCENGLCVQLYDSVKDANMSASRPLRSILYIPASKPRALDKARGLEVDAIIFDLEDAVSVDEKIASRSTLAEALNAGGYGARIKIVRINAFDTPWGLMTQRPLFRWARMRFCCQK